MLFIPYPAIARDLSIVIGTSSSSLVAADAVSWAGCGTSGTSVQSALNAINSSGGGGLKLTGPGSLLVKAPLQIYNNTRFYGDPARSPYGMVLVGDNRTSSCSSGGTFRHGNCPIIIVTDQNAYSADNVTIWNIHFDGSRSGYPLSAPAVSVVRSTGVVIIYAKINGARTGGVSIRQSAGTNIKYLSLDMARSTSGEPEGGAGVWIAQSTGTVLENSLIEGKPYYDAGLPVSDPNSSAGAAPTMDLVASYGSSGTVIRHNSISYSNTAGVYLAACTAAVVCANPGWNTAREVNATVWDNQIRYFRQHGIDVADTDDSHVDTNQVQNTGYASLALGNSHNNVVRYNTFVGSGSVGSWDAGLLFLWGSSGNYVAANDIKGLNSSYAVYFRAGNGAPVQNTDPQGNIVTGNNLWMGGAGYVGGVLPGNTYIPNNLY